MSSSEGSEPTNYSENYVWVGVKIPEVFKWLDNTYSDRLSTETLQSWMAVGAIEPIRDDKQVQVKEHNQFCVNDLLIEMDDLSIRKNEQRRSKAQINPFQKIGRSIFKTRVTVKAVNLDSLINYTNPLDQHNRIFATLPIQ